MAISAELDFVCVDVVYFHIGQRLALITHRNMHLAKPCYPAPALAPCLRKPRQTCAKHGRCLPGIRACPSTIEQTLSTALARASMPRENVGFLEEGWVLLKIPRGDIDGGEGIRACLENDAHNFAAEQLPRMASADAEEGGSAPRDRWGGFGCGHRDFVFCVCCLRM